MLVHELAELAEEFSDPELRFRAANARFIYGMHAGDAAQLNAALALMLELAAAIGQPILRCGRTAQDRTLAGDLDEAEKLTMEAAAVAAEHSRPEAGLITFGQLLAIRTEQDRLAELAEPAERFASRNPRIGLLRLTCALIAAETGHREDAAAMLAQIAADGFVFPLRSDPGVQPGALCRRCAAGARARARGRALRPATSMALAVRDPGGHLLARLDRAEPRPAGQRARARRRGG